MKVLWKEKKKHWKVEVENEAEVDILYLTIFADKEGDEYLRCQWIDMAIECVLAMFKEWGVSTKADIVQYLSETLSNYLFDQDDWTVKPEKEIRRLFEVIVGIMRSTLGKPVKIKTIELKEI